MSKSRMPALLGVAAVGGLGYYLYSAGGDPKVAEKKFESDIHSASASVKSHLPGRSPDAEKKLGASAAEVGGKIDNAIAEADKQFGVAKSNAEAFAKDARANATKKINDFDKKVEDGAAKAKSGVSGWFGFGGSK